MDPQEPRQARDPAEPVGEGGPSSRSDRLLLAVLALATFASVLNTTMVNVAIPLIGRDLDVSGAEAGWIVTGYVLVFAVGIPIYGRISDFFGLREIFSVALVVFAAGSLVCALAPSFPVLIAGRALQAAGSAAIPALSYGSVAKIFPPGGQGTAFGILSSSVGVGGAAGPILGGLGAGLGGWRILFFGTLLILVVLFLAGLYALPDTGSAAPGSGAVRNLDLPGGLLLGAAAGLALFGITRIQQAGISAPLSWGSVVLAVLAASMFSARIRTADVPFAPPELFRNRTFLAASFAALLAQFAYLGGALFLTPLLLVGQGGLSTLSAGLVLAPSAVAVAVLSPYAGRLSDRVGPRAVLLGGLTLLVVCLFFVSSYAVGASAYVVASALLAMGVGAAGITSSAADAVSIALPEETAGVGLGIYQMLFFLGAGAGAAVLGTFLATRTAAGTGAVNPLYSLAPSAGPFSDAFLLASLAALLSLAAAFGVSAKTGGRATTERPSRKSRAPSRS